MNEIIDDVKRYMQHERWDKRNARAYDAYRKFSSVNGWKTFLADTMSDVSKNAKVLDFGTGTGFIAEILAEIGYRVTGIDLSDQMLARARINIAKAKLSKQVTLLQNDGELLNFESYSFDAVISRWVIWTLPNPEKAIREMIRVTRQGGRIIIIDGKNSAQNRIQRFRNAMVDFIITRRPPWWRDKFIKQIDPLLPRYSLSQIEAVFKKENLINIDCQGNIEQVTESWVQRALFGSDWTSFIIKAVKQK